MGTTAVLSAIFTLLAGIGIFLIACQMMSTNLESASSDKLKQLFAKASKSKLLGVGIGAFGTAAIQSSGATTVMTIGFVNAGIISLSQAATIIYGANIGTTITAQIVALGMFGGANTLSTTIIFSAFAGVGAFMALFSNKSTWQTWGGILSGFGMLFVGLSLMSNSMSDFAALDGVKTFLASISNPIILVLIGAIFTAIIQSSSVMTSIALTMVVTGLISLNQGIFLTMGSNIGSCVVAIIAGMASGKNAKRTALIHLLFNCSGVVIFLLVGWILSLVTSGSLNYGVMFERMFPDAPQTQLAMFHTFFNVVTVILMLPFTNLLVKLVSKMIPEKKTKTAPSEERLYYIDEHLLSTPPIAVLQTKNEIVNMAEIALHNYEIACDVVCTLDYGKIEQFRKNENELNFLNREISRFVVQLSKCEMNDDDHNFLATTFHTVSDIERVGDYAENIIEYADKLKAIDQRFSEIAVEEIRHLQQRIEDLFQKTMKAYVNADLTSFEDANDIEEDIDALTDKMGENHIVRLRNGDCTPDVGAQYLSLASDSERIADHFINIAKCIKQWNVQKH